LEQYPELLAGELKKLRKTFRAVLEAYAFHVESRMTHIGKTLGEGFSQEMSARPMPQTGAALNGRRPPEQLRQELEFLHTQLVAMNMKPCKGRRKDLKKIEKLLDSCAWTLELEKPVAKAP
jgi:hypothetical protein